MAKKLIIKLDSKAENRIEKLKDFYDNKPDFRGIGGNTMDYDDIIQIALRALAEDVGLE